MATTQNITTAAQLLEAGASVVWVIDPQNRTVAVHCSPGEAAILGMSETLPGQDVLPGFAVPVRQIFAGP